MPDLPGDALIKLFPQRHIPVILLLIFKVGKQVHKQSKTEREDWLTTRLYRRLIREPSFRDGPLQIHLQPDIVSSEVDIDTNVDVLKLNPPQKLSRSTITSCQPIDETQHDLDKRPFTIYHLLIAV